MKQLTDREILIVGMILASAKDSTIEDELQKMSAPYGLQMLRFFTSQDTIEELADKTNALVLELAKEILEDV